MDFKTYSAKSVDEAINNAVLDMKTTSDKLEIEVIDKGAAGILGIGARPAIIKVTRVDSVPAVAEQFLYGVFKTMNMDVNLVTEFNEEESTLSIDLQGDDMGILIGKRGQTLDALQYLTNMVINKSTGDNYIRVKLDIENYRERREESLERLARSVASKVKKTRRSVSLEPMNPYERRIIHASLQNDRYVITASEGEEPYRHVVVSLKSSKERKENDAEN